MPMLKFPNFQLSALWNIKTVKLKKHIHFCLIYPFFNAPSKNRKNQEKTIMVNFFPSGVAGIQP